MSVSSTADPRSLSPVDTAPSRTRARPSALLHGLSALAHRLNLPARVVDRLRGVHPALEAVFDAAYAKKP